MSPKLELKTEQKLILTPMLQQALKVLQLPAIELNDLVRQELAENPMLEEKEDSFQANETEMREIEPTAGEMTGRTAEVSVDESGLGPNGFDMEEWDRYFADQDYEVPTHERETPAEAKIAQVTRPPTLEEHLLWQLRLVARTDEEFRIGEYIVGNLDDRGFLPRTLADLSQELKVTESQVADVLAVVQGLEPAGIAARSVTESLLIQLRNLPERQTLAEAIVEHHFEALEKHQLDKIAKAEKVTHSEVLAAVQQISGLDPFPGRHQFSGSVEYVVPDVLVEKHDDQYVIQVKDDGLPELRVSRAYRQLLRQKEGMSPETRQYLEERLQRAVWLIRSIEQRRKTLYRVVETIVEVQKAFFEKGVEALKPLTLREIAERVHLHESTISRVTSRKYVQTPRGVFELKYFFSSQVKTTDGGAISSTSVKALLAELISEEDPAHPKSDQTLMEELKARGFDLARRTVAKYREELQQPPAHRRRRTR